MIFQNDLMQLIQYAPSTEKVLKRPLLIVPPWINKFYVLDLTPEKSFIKWCVDQGLTVFCISWVNPDASLAQKTFEDYVREGPLAALDAIKQATGEVKVARHRLLRRRHAARRRACLHGGAAATSASSRRRSSPRRSTSPMPAISRSSSIEEQVKAVEQRMAERGYLEGRSMATVFNLLRSNDLIWPYVINNYLKGKTPFPFDLLYWNSDATRMPAANHSFYLRNCYLDNRLPKGEDRDRQHADRPEIDQGADLHSGDARGPHRAGEIGVARLEIFGGPVRFVLSGSGHIAGVVNPPEKQKYQYWTGAKPRNADLDGWLAKAKEHPGSWWPDWLAWLKQGRPKPRARSRRRQAQADRGRAGKLRQSAGVKRQGGRVAGYGHAIVPALTECYMTIVIDYGGLEGH